MTNRNLLQAMGRIAPELIADAAPDVPQKKSANKTWVRWGAVAACLILMIAVTIIIVPHTDRGNQGGHQVERPAISKLQVINGFWYEPLSNPAWYFDQYPELAQIAISKLSDQYAIKDKDLGEYIGIVPAHEKAGLPEGKAYHWSAYPNLDSIIIVERNGDYTVYIANTFMPFDNYHNSSIILKKYNLPKSSISIEVENMEISLSDSCSIFEFCSIIANKEHDSEHAYTNRIWQAWQDERGESGVRYDGKEFSYDNTEIRDEFTAFRTANIQSIWINTENGFEIHVLFDPKFNYFIMCNRIFNLSQAESEQLSILLGTK